MYNDFLDASGVAEPGFSLQVLAICTSWLRAFHCNPSRMYTVNPQYKLTYKIYPRKGLSRKSFFEEQKRLKQKPGSASAERALPFNVNTLTPELFTNKNLE